MNTRIYKTIWVSVLLFFMACGLSPLRAEETSLAVILSFSGSVELRPKATPQSLKKAGLMRILYEGDRLTLADKAEVTVKFLSDGRREKAQGKGEVTITAQGCKSKGSTLRKGEGLVKLAASRDKRIVGDLLGTRLVRDGEKAKHRTELVVTLNPSFTWKGDGGKVLFRLNRRIGEAFGDEEILWQDRIIGDGYVYPAKAPSLEWGTRYYWRVLRTPSEPEEVIADGLSRIANSKEAAVQISAARNRLKEGIETLDADSLTEIVILFMDNEGFDEALPLLKRLALSRPEDPAVHYLLAVVYKGLGDDDLFKQEKEKVKEFAGDDDTYRFPEPK